MFILLPPLPAHTAQLRDTIQAAALQSIISTIARISARFLYALVGSLIQRKEAVMADHRTIPHCIRSQSFSRRRLEDLFATAEALRNGMKKHCMSDRILVSLFYEPSTRTRLSFESAAIRLGGRIIGTENAAEFSSVIKGESLEDSIRIIGAYGDVIVLRHTQDDAAERAAAVSRVPIINAGCGMGQHPTQALLDIYTITRRRGGIDGVTIALVGDLLHGRTIRSLAYLLGKFSGVRILFVAPTALQVGADILRYLQKHSVAYEQLDRLDDIVGTVDVIYTTRVQRERIPGLSGPEFTRLQQAYRIDLAMASRMRPDAFIMHPLPRNDELPPEINPLPQAAYFEQAENGLWVREALLYEIFR